MKNYAFSFILIVLVNLSVFAQSNQTRGRISEFGIKVGYLEKGTLNMITDVEGVKVGHLTLKERTDIRTGVTAILPHGGNIFQEKVPAAIYCFNSFGKLAGYTQVQELGNIETPIILTNTLNVGTAMEAVVKYTLEQKGNENVRSVNAVVGETNDGYLNDIRGQHVTREHVIQAIKSAVSGKFEEGCVGAGTGTTALGFKGGIGSASRKTIAIDGKQYTVGVLLQSNFGRELYINGEPVTTKIKSNKINKKEDGSCMIIIATDAPLSTRNLERLAKRAFIGMGKTTNVMSNSSGDFAIAFSTAYHIPNDSKSNLYDLPPLFLNDAMTTLFQAVEEATQEAVYNSLFMATTTTGFGGNTVNAIPIEQVLKIINK
ncbi:MAG: P1 family peptidase [Bacteroidetes bacterium]|nr:P1 family peptidase [Bacteroidota bacterium]